jgi:hypothetical protein
MIQIVYQMLCLCKSLALNDNKSFAHHLHTSDHELQLTGGLLLGCEREQKAGGEGV